MKPLTLKESGLVAGVLALCVLAAALPAFAQNQAYHHFADARMFFGVPRTFDSLSNLGFLLLGMYGLTLMARDQLEFFSKSLKWSAFFFFAGFVATALGSTYYHLSPDDAGLAWDRLGMVVAFAGVLGMAAAHRISERAGYAVLATALAIGPISVGYWTASGSLTPYSMMQFGGIALAGAMMWAPARGRGPAWAALLGAYVLAKVCESADASIFAMTGHWISGHTLKHLFAALPVLAVTGPLRKPSLNRAFARAFA